MSGKRLRKVIPQLLLMFCILKENKYTWLIFQNRAEPVKNPWTKKKKMVLSSSKKIPELIHEITLKLKDDLYCLNCYHSFRTENKLKSHKEVCKNKDFVQLKCDQKIINKELKSK